MSKTDGSVLGIWGQAVRKRGIGTEEVVPKGGRSTKQEAEYFHEMYDKRDETAENRKKDAPKMVDTFYDLVTDFYENGWGQSFHFAPRGRNETFRESIVRHEHFLASRLELREGDFVLDAGCGIGGPMRNIAEFSGAKILGITINEYQVRRGNRLNEQSGLNDLCKLEEGNFLDMRFEDNTFDKVFCIEASCHAGDRHDVFGECFRVLKPGGLFGTYEWVTTDKYDPSNPKHVKARQQIEKGNALPEMASDKEAIQAMRDVGFEIEYAVDLAESTTKRGQLPWYGTLEARCSWENLTQSRAATVVTHALCWTMEKLGLAPKGTVSTHEILLEARDGLVSGGQAGIFTPMLLLIARKPAKKEQ